MVGAAAAASGALAGFVAGFATVVLVVLIVVVAVRCYGTNCGRLSRLLLALTEPHHINNKEIFLK